MLARSFQVLTSIVSVSVTCPSPGVREWKRSVRKDNGEHEINVEILILSTPDYSKCYWKPLPGVFYIVMPYF